MHSLESPETLHEEWSVCFDDGSRILLSESHARDVHAHTLAIHRDASLCRRLVTDWDEMNQSKET